MDLSRQTHLSQPLVKLFRFSPLYLRRRVPAPHSRRPGKQAPSRPASVAFGGFGYASGGERLSHPTCLGKGERQADMATAVNPAEQDRMAGAGRIWRMHAHSPAWHPLLARSGRSRFSHSGGHPRCRLFRLVSQGEFQIAFSFLFFFFLLAGKSRKGDDRGTKTAACRTGARDLGFRA
jgi:hypothetical protein